MAALGRYGSPSPKPSRKDETPAWVLFISRGPQVIRYHTSRRRGLFDFPVSALSHPIAIRPNRLKV